jgi:uncharacterized protein GlcG (DUF336 family)
MSDLIEPLEDRRLFSIKGVKEPIQTPVLLTPAQVSKILAQAASQMLPTQAVAVSDRDGHILGIFAGPQTTEDTKVKAIMRARTGGFFESSQQTFSTRTARFIIQDNFPFPIRNTGGGPLYGVEFSDLPGSDVLGPNQVPAVSGDPGGLGLYVKGRNPVGGIGVAGDGNDVAARSDLKLFADQKVYDGHEEQDFDEAVAEAGFKGFQPNKEIRANRIFLAGTGLRFPYTVTPAAHGHKTKTLAELTATGVGTVQGAPSVNVPAGIVGAQPNPFPAATFSNIPGVLKNTTNVAGNYGIRASDDLLPDGTADPDRLTADDVAQVITDAVNQAKRTRSGIRLPIGEAAVVHVSVVDRDGTLLGVFRMYNDGTNFSFDVSVQKARTAAFFSDDTHAFSSRAIGFMAQKYFPTGINNGSPGPLFHIQNDLSALKSNLKAPLANGITIFPGGAPLYKNGHLVGAVGISGDGVDQDDLIAFGGTKHFHAPDGIRSDQLSKSQVADFIGGKIQDLVNMGFQFTTPFFIGPDNDPSQTVTNRILYGYTDFRLPFQKFPRNPEI